MLSAPSHLVGAADRPLLNNGERDDFVDAFHQSPPSALKSEIMGAIRQMTAECWSGIRRAARDLQRATAIGIAEPIQPSTWNCAKLSQK